MREKMEEGTEQRNKDRQNEGGLMNTVMNLRVP
jgi:hypothetical protein